MENIIKDSRFAHIATDPRFRKVPKYDRKVKIDKRFQSMFTDDKFKVKYSVDKRGKPINYISSENLQKYYSLSSEEDTSEQEDESSPVANVKDEQEAGEEFSSKLGENSDCVSSDLSFIKDGKTENGKPESARTIDKFGFIVSDISDKVCVKKAQVRNDIPDQVKRKLLNLDIDYARGEGILLSDSSSDDESTDDDVAEFEEDMAHAWGELDKEATTTEVSTNRLAVCNMDWDRIKATDLMVLFSSFTPREGFIKSIAIYPSEFGKQRMKEEDVKGPLELTSQKVTEDDDENNPDKDEEREEGNSFHMEKLRKYQLNRLKYFYAVVVCDSVATADKLYAECDGLEYESSAIRLDLRFIPDDMTFDDEPREICNNMPDPSKYTPRYFVTKALQQAKVECTWDETDPNRVELAEKIMKSNGDVDDEDIQAYLASSDEDSCEESDKEDEESVSGDEEDRVGKYRNLIKEIQEREKTKSDKDVEMEVTWGIGLKEKTEKLVKEKMKEQKEELTPFEKYLDKRKEKKKLKKKERKAAFKGEEEAFSDDDFPSDVDLNDPYFKEELEKGDKNAKKKKGSKKKNKDDSSDNEEKRKARAELELLLMDSDSKNHFNLTEIMKQEKDAGKKKRRKGKSHDKEVLPEDNFQIDVKDPRFEAIFTSHHFNIDPADPHFRKTKAMDALVIEKLSRRENESKGNFKGNKVSEDSGKRDPELSLLVKSVKRKTENMKAKKRQKIV